MKQKHLPLLLFMLLPLTVAAERLTPVDYVSTLVGTESKHSLSTGNTYPAIAMPWGMNFWMPQTGRMGDGWAYVYSADKIRGFKQTHQPSPWITTMVSSPSCLKSIGLQHQRQTSYTTKKSEPAGSVIKPRLPSPITIRCISPTMT